MTIPLQDLRREYGRLAGELESRLLDTLRTGWYLQGEQVRGFEAEFAEYCGVGHAVSVGNGTDALEIALRTLGCGPGDEVVTVANAGMYSSSAIVAVGATPVLVDVRDEDLLVDPRAVADALTERTSAVVVTHLYGKLADVGGVRAAVSGRPVPLLEDCAQAHGARRGDRRAGSLGDMAAFSFYPTKNLGALGDGGALATAEAELADRVAQLRQYGWERRFHAVVAGGRNSRLDELQAAALRVKLGRLEEQNARRRVIALRYEAACDAASTLRPAQASGPDHVHHLFVVRAENRRRARSHLERRGVASAVHYPVPDHRQPALRSVGFRALQLPVTERASEEILTVPCFPELTDEEVDRVCDALGEL